MCVCMCVRACAREHNLMMHVFTAPMTVYECTGLILEYSPVIMCNLLKFLFAAAVCGHSHC